jgi:hypothetical protein
MIFWAFVEALTVRSGSMEEWKVNLETDFGDASPADEDRAYRLSGQG